LEALQVIRDAANPRPSEQHENVSKEIHQYGGADAHDSQHFQVRDGYGCVLLVSAWATGIGWSEQKAQQASGAHIQMGEGHFNRDGKAFHYWDQEKEIPAVCSRCHAANGVPEYLREGKNSPSPQVKNAFACTNCHADMLSYARHTVAKVTFPSGVTVDSGHNDSNLCMTCHQDRESTASVNKAITGLDPDVYPGGVPLLAHGYRRQRQNRSGGTAPCQSLPCLHAAFDAGGLQLHVCSAGSWGAVSQWPLHPAATLRLA
jgi:hypothetical protein